MDDQKAPMSLEEFEVRFRALALKFAPLGPYELRVVPVWGNGSRSRCCLMLIGFHHPCVIHETNDHKALAAHVQAGQIGEIIGDGGLEMAIRQAEEVYEELVEYHADILRQRLQFIDPSRPVGSIDYQTWVDRMEKRRQDHHEQAEDHIAEREKRRPARSPA